MPPHKTPVPRNGNPSQQPRGRKSASRAQSNAAWSPSAGSPGSSASSSSAPTATPIRNSAQEKIYGAGSRDSWLESGSNIINSMVEKSQGAVSKSLAWFVKKYLPGTKIIFVVGQTGAGKSTLLREITGRDVYVGESVQSGTQRYEACPALIEDKQYIFVDTVGFGAADKNNWDTFEDIASCLDAFGTLTEVAGILFVWEPGDRVKTQDLLTLQWIKCFCGPTLFQAVTIITTKWDDFSENGFKRRWASMQETLAQPEFAGILNPQESKERFPGASLYHHGFPGGAGTESSCSDIYPVENVEARSREIQDFITAKYSTAVACNLQLTKELTNKIRLSDTQAAKALKLAEPTTFKVHLQGNMACVLPVEKPHVQEPNAETASAEEEGAGKPERSAKSSKTPDSADTPGGSGQPPPPRDGKTWCERLVKWAEIAMNSAEYFADLKKKEEQAKKQRRGRPADPVQSPSILAMIVDWWNGDK